MICDHAEYIEHWLRVLKTDKRAIFTASSQAQKAADYLVERADLKVEATVYEPAVAASSV